MSGGGAFLGGDVVLMVGLIAAAMAGEAVSVDAGASVVGEGITVPEPPPAPPATQGDLLEEAVALRRIGAFADAASMLATAAATPGDVPDEVAYHRGVLLEVTEQWSEAVDAYRNVTASWPDSTSAADAWFRMAYCLEEMGDHRESMKTVRKLQRRGTWSGDDERSMELQRGIAETRAGKTRRGIRRILKALNSGTDGRSWIRAKARLALVRVQTEAAAAIVFKGDAKAARQLTKRSKLIASAEKQAIAMFHLGEPEFALEGLLLLGDAYVALYDAMVEYPPPRSIPPDQRDAYRQTVVEKSAILRSKAFARYDEGVRVAARTQWVGSVTDRLTQARDRVRPETPE